MEKGNLSINSENILPIIKKWLYSDMDIFLRELVSNGCDAVTKLEKLRELGEAPLISAEEKYQVKVTLDTENKTIQISDNGIGMTEEEIKKYINQIAFSGAGDFIEKYKEKMGDGESDIIGHFGLGFYSAFMVADTVQIDSLSFTENAQPARWISDGSIEYEILESDKTTRGTDITLFIGDENKDFFSEFKLKEILNKYCSFMPVEIYFEKVEKPSESDESDKAKIIDQDADAEEETEEMPVPINNTKPLWLKPTNECTDDEYKEFYHNVFMDYDDPLFWIHLNMDYPFKLKGILYFPKLKNNYETIEGQVKLYCNQVFVADNVKEVIPEFLLLLKGAIDCPEIPLNVSRSFLQNDSNVAKMSGYITKKVADKLNSIYKKDKENYCKYWDDINVFIKYGCIKDRSFYEKVEDCIVYKTTKDEYFTLKDFLDINKNKTDNNLYYVSDKRQQAQYIKLFEEAGLEAVLLEHVIDNPFMSSIENYGSNAKFLRIDSDISKALKGDDESSDGNEELEALFTKNLNDDKLKISVESLKNENIPAVMVLSEQSRRMQEMSKMFAGSGMDFPEELTFVLNKNNNLVKTLLTLKEKEGREEDVKLICEQIFDLAQMGQRPLKPEEMNAFVLRSNKILSMIAAL